MTTKKIVLIVVAVLVSLGLIVAIFVGGIIGMVFYQLANSDAAKVSAEFSAKQRAAQAGHWRS